MIAMSDFTYSAPNEPKPCELYDKLYNHEDCLLNRFKLDIFVSLVALLMLLKQILLYYLFLSKPLVQEIIDLFAQKHTHQSLQLSQHVCVQLPHKAKLPLWPPTGVCPDVGGFCL